MNIPVPPTPVRRIVRDPLYLLAVPVALAVLGLPAWVLSLFARWRWARTPARLFGMAYAAVLLDVSIVFACWRISLLTATGRAPRSRWTTLHQQALDRHLDRFVDRAGRWAGLRLTVEGDEALGGGRSAYLVLGNHAGVGDSLLLAHVISAYLHRVPRIVLKRMLLWDPAMDYLLRRLGAYFLPSARVPYARRQELLAQFVRSVRDGEGVLIFPEGRNWTPGRHDEDREEAIAEGEDAVAEWLGDHPRVLRPRSGGVLRVLAERPDTVPVLTAHRGLQHLTGVGPIWAWLREPTPVTVAVLPAEGLDVSQVGDPRKALADNGVQQWLDEQWARIDAWLAGA
ncbi:1-acyl-sn-glycerol-3-phosphate acyltransferase [Calidifontibacter sp. DB0510]|uniref:1-acyl-sn-glycerol-3-phosphate acyltransferase n=1 Tax=Metallococcus carri TaxID=1656884 RepID=A0A967EAF4_9MICO|nr:1-acyl-sn-glycerol-3-phosphate acyltransferase [Metallococcus carri]NHN57407.1 1-acyl-sn-glycerol-3-phosphate acyltransferase [Metallococcus carri]NOP39197.1 1-acyl-sn-glycerol-3-phosphate acyltransferase [Calidifontibacter sp. DB2511S]